jgi:hypothetical protein
MIMWEDGVKQKGVENEIELKDIAELIAERIKE